MKLNKCDKKMYQEIIENDFPRMSRAGVKTVGEVREQLPEQIDVGDIYPSGMQAPIDRYLKRPQDYNLWFENFEKNSSCEGERIHVKGKFVVQYKGAIDKRERGLFEKTFIKLGLKKDTRGMRIPDNPEVYPFKQAFDLNWMCD